MNNDIIKLLNFNPDEMTIEDIEVINDTKIIYISKVKKVMYCPLCSTRMHSKGITYRSVNHPILQDGFKLILHLNQRRWYCQSLTCSYHETDGFSFALSNQRNTNITPI